MKAISVRTFRNCCALEKVTMIDSYAFDGCTSLKEITIPSTLTDIKIHSFPSDTKINKI